MNKKELMIDLETLRQKNDPVVISVAAVVFDRKGVVYNSNVWYIDLDDSLKHGFQINKETLSWWLQWPELLKSQLENPNAVPVIDFLKDFELWVLKFIFVPTGIITWGDAAFDQNIIESMYNKFNLHCPIYFRNYRDVRTIKSLAEELNFDIQIERKTEHDPLNDALYNVKFVTEFYKKLNGKYEPEEKIKETDKDEVAEFFIEVANQVFDKIYLPEELVEKLEKRNSKLTKAERQNFVDWALKTFKECGERRKRK